MITNDILKSIQGFIRDTSDFINISRKKIFISTDMDSLFVKECPKGFGYYLVRPNDCSIYKKCEYWNKKYSSITLNKCLDDKYFSLESFQCVERSRVQCESDSPKFVFTGKENF